MGTRGVIGFATEGNLKVSYCHYDSYPSGEGQGVLNFIRQVCEKNLLATLEANAKALVMVASDSKPTVAEQNYYLNKEQTADLKVSNRKADDWYCLLRGAQGAAGLALICEGALKHMIDSSDFPKDSLFCEWGYILDMDNQVLEVYKGFQKKQHKQGRFADKSQKPKNWKAEYEGQNFYYPCALVLSIPFKDIATDYKAAEEKLLNLEKQEEDAAA